MKPEYKEAMSKFLDGCLVLDTETTGIDDTDDIIEYSASIYDDTYDIQNMTIRIKNTVPIPPEASAVHFIVEKELAECGTYNDYADSITFLLENKKYYIGHNVDFDRRMLRQNHIRHCKEAYKHFENDTRWICTLKFAKKIFANDTSFKNYQLSYLWFKFGLNESCEKTIVPHSAEDDVYMCAKVLEHLTMVAMERGLIDSTAEDLGAEIQELCRQPIVYTHMPFGKHQGKLMSEVPMDYLMWMIQKSDILNEESTSYNPDHAETIASEIMRREEENGF